MEESARLYVFDEFTLDSDRACLMRNGEKVSLRPKAFATLEYLIEHRGRVTTKDDLIRVLWPKVIVTEDSLVKCIQEVRGALRDDQHRYIKTIPRRGYLFDAPVTVRTSLTADRAEAAEAVRSSTQPRAKLVPLTAAAALLLLLAGFTVYYLMTGPVDVSSSAQPPSAAQSVAVLPFVSIGPDPAEDYFSDGISEELLNVLANVPGLHVPSRTSSFTFKGTNADLRTVAAALNVNHVLEGSVRKAGTRVRITAQLIDVATDSHLWSATFDRELTDVFAIQDEIAKSVAAALQVELLGTELADAPGSRTDDIEAYDAYLLGMHYLRMRRMEDNIRVRQSFLRAIELDPGYAAAYAELATAVLAAQGNGIMDRDAALAQAASATARALALDPDLASAYVARGQLARYRGDYAAADADLRRAIDLQPSLADAHFLRVFALGGLGRFTEARAALEKALELDPLNGFFNRWMGNVQLALGNPARARVYDRRAVEFEPSQPNAYAGLGDIAVMTGHVDEGLSWYLKGVAQDPGHAHITALVGAVYLSLGDGERARIWFDKAASLYKTGAVSRFFHDFMPVDRRPADAGALLEVLREVPASHFTALGSRVFRKAALQTGDIAGIEGFHRQHWPELFEPQPLVNANNLGAATDVAWLRLARDERDQARVLLDRVLEVLRDPEERSIDPPEWSFVMVEIEALALQGRNDAALAALRRGIDAGWRVEWWQAEGDPTLASISREPEFRAMIAEVKADLALQLERVGAMERSGEIDGVPKIAAALAR
jgi:TolB-like protein/DNA-binding winged helix-turn-helix (wHTH) protein/Flp pilus assembly protein TadD